MRTRPDIPSSVQSFTAPDQRGEEAVGHEPQDKPFGDEPQDRWENKEKDLWRISLLFLALLAAGLAANSWEAIRTLPASSLRLEGLPAGVFLLALLFAGYVWHKKREIDEMRRVLAREERARKEFVRALQEREQAPPSETQLERLMEIVTRSQRGYRELIDSFDDLVFALSLDGEVRAANKRVAEMFSGGGSAGDEAGIMPFSEIVGRKIDELVEEPTRAQAEKGLPRFLERRHWSGTVRVRVKRTGAVRYLECVLHPILGMDGEAEPRTGRYGAEGAQGGGHAGPPLRGEEADAARTLRPPQRTQGKKGRGYTVVGIGGIARDVTQLRESETRFSELFETLQEGVYFTTPEGNLLDANPALVRMLGYTSKEELLGVAVQDLYWDPAERQSRLRELDRGMGPEAGASGLGGQELTLRRKDGSPLVCLDTSTAIRDPVGRVVRYQGTLLDITQRREMEKRLREEQEFARRMVECFPDSIVVLDAQARYTYASPRITEQLGYLPEDLLGRSLGERSDPDDRGELLRVFQELISGSSPFATMEYRTQHKDGSWRRFRATAGPLTGPDGRITGVIASARDITQLKQLEQQLLQSEKLAAMGQMIAGVAHELNNPLTAILGVSDLIRERATRQGPEDDEDAALTLRDAQGKKGRRYSDLARHAELAHQQARRAAEIVQNLLAFARPPALKKTAVSLNDLVRRTLQLHEYALRVNNIAVDFVPAPELPPVVADPSQLVQVFLNLVINAEQAMREEKDAPQRALRPSASGQAQSPAPAGAGQRMQGALRDSPSGQGARGTLCVRLGRGKAEGQEDAGQVWVSFADDGPGIPLDIQPKIFDPFFTTKRPGRGTGLGLSICLAIVKEHGGTIDAQSTPGHGATFTVSLPVESHKAEVRTPKQAEAQRAGAKPESRGRVLVVEDEPSIRELIQDGLASSGMKIESVGTGSEAVERVRSEGHRYDVVLCDVKMPGMSGIQVFEALKTRPDGSPQPFVFMTGDLADVDTLEFIARTADDDKEGLHHGKARLISKPFKMADLVNALEECLKEAARI